MQWVKLIPKWRGRLSLINKDHGQAKQFDAVRYLQHHNMMCEKTQITHRYLSIDPACACEPKRKKTKVLFGKPNRSLLKQQPRAKTISHGPKEKEKA